MNAQPNKTTAPAMTKERARRKLIVARTPENAADLEAAREREEFMARLERLSNYVDATLDEMERLP